MFLLGGPAGVVEFVASFVTVIYGVIVVVLAVVATTRDTYAGSGGGPDKKYNEVRRML
jgi:hypothetical protein